jgi:uncharacterized protein (TIGR00369 family)
MTHRVAETLDELAGVDDVLSRSGLEFMQDMVEGRLAGPPIGESLGFRPVEAEAGRVVFEGRPEFGALNPVRGVHGGWYGAILDSCMACAVMTVLEQGRTYTTLEYKVNITRAIPPGTRVLAAGEVQHAGRSTAVARGELRGANDGLLYATGSTTCFIMDGAGGR